MNNMDISELLKECKRKCCLIMEKTIKIGDKELSFDYWYYTHLPNPFSSYYDNSKKEFHIIIQRDAPNICSGMLKQKFELPEETKKIKIDYRGRNLDKLSDEEVIGHFFPKLNPENQGKDENGVDRSGEDGWLGN